MTRQFNQVVDCPKCGITFPAESGFCAWMRAQPELNSRGGLVRADMDHIVHRYKFPESGRNLQAIMLIEAKSHVNFNKPELIRVSEADTLHIINQLVRNRRTNIHKKAKWQSGGAGIKAYSLQAKRNVTVRFYGVHGLYFSGTRPEDSDRIEWDRKQIDETILKNLLLFNLDPDTLKPIDLRIHQKKVDLLFDMER